MGHNVLRPASVWYHGHCPLFLCTKFELVPSVNFHQMCIWANYFSAWNVRVCPMWMCTKCEWAPSHYMPAPSLCYFSMCICTHYFCAMKYQSVPNVNVHEMSECAQFECAPNVSVPNVKWRQMWVGSESLYICICTWYCHIFFLVISVPKISESAQCECTTVATFFSLSFLCPNCQCAPNVNVLVLPPF